MLTKVRENIYIGDDKAYKNMDDLVKEGITALVIVADEMSAPSGANKIKVFKVGLVDGPNYGFVKDLSCHIPKYLTENGEIVLIQGLTGLKRTVFVAARTICELENRSIHEIFNEIKELEPEVNLSKVYF